MKLAHLIFGILVFAIFLFTGQYMEFYYPDMTAVRDGLRLLLRTRHIFILLAGLLNILIGVYFHYRLVRWRRALQFVGSGIIFIATSLLIAAFFYDTKLSNLDTPFSHYGLYLLLAGTLLHLFAGIRAAPLPTHVSDRN